MNKAVKRQIAAGLPVGIAAMSLKDYEMSFADGKTVSVIAVNERHARRLAVSDSGRELDGIIKVIEAHEAQ